VVLGVSKVLTGTCGGDGPRHEKGRRHHKFCTGEGVVRLVSKYCRNSIRDEIVCGWVELYESMIELY